MRDKPPPDAISVEASMPTPHQSVMCWVSDESVAIEHLPIVGWNTFSDGWWTGLPGNYISLRDKDWTVTHWRPIY